MRFFLDQKTGFICKDRIIVVTSSDGNFFYVKENPQRNLHFNLPEGEYLTNNKLEKTEPRRYKLSPLPEANIKRQLPRDFEIYFCENPNKCSVELGNDIAKIFFDNSFKNLPEYFLTYVKFHELGHYKYSGQKNKSEKFCDGFAYNKMIELGYNPTQIYHAQKTILSNKPEAIERKKYIYNKAIKSF